MCEIIFHREITKSLYRFLQGKTEKEEVSFLEYTSLYRKFRPTTFGEMVGQEHITRTLKNQIIAGRVGHAYLFNGGRGTGKTSAAKILARAVNCLNPKDGEPCNECEICKAAMAGTLTDIVEMDAASNNSVEDIRQIRDEVNFLPTVAKYRVYIIDEVHMLSTGAFNALLKTLEEPPAHVKFILATTEPQKLPATILSRCQRFDFKKIANEDIAEHLTSICEKMNIEITKEAVSTIAILSEGAMRDALSILERCLQDGETKIDEDKIKDLVGIPKLQFIEAILEAIINCKVEDALNVIEEVVKEGKDIQNFLWEMIKYAKDILVYGATKKAPLYSEEETKKLAKLTENVDRTTALGIVYALSNLENEMKWSSQKLILFQVTVIKLCARDFGATGGSEAEQIQQLEQKVNYLQKQVENLRHGEVIHKKVTNVEIPTQKTVVEAPKMPQETLVKRNNVVPTKTGENLACWPKVLKDLKDTGKIMLYTNLMNTTAKEVNDMTVGIVFPKAITPFGKTILEKSENQTELERRISMELGKTMRVKYIENASSQPEMPQANAIETFAEDLDLPIHIIEE